MRLILQSLSQRYTYTGMYTFLSLQSPYRTCLSDGDVMHEVTSWLEFQFDQIMLFPRVTKGFLARNGSPQCCSGCLAPIFGRHCAIQERATFQSRDNWWKMQSSSGLNFWKKTAGEVHGSHDRLWQATYDRTALETIAEKKPLSLRLA